MDLGTIKNIKYIPAIQMPFKVTVTGKRLDSFTECITTQGCECINGNDRASIDMYFLVTSQSLSISLNAKQFCGANPRPQREIVELPWPQDICCSNNR